MNLTPADLYDGAADLTRNAAAYGDNSDPGGCYTPLKRAVAMIEWAAQVGHPDDQLYATIAIGTATRLVEGGSMHADLPTLLRDIVDVCSDHATDAARA